jgi:hypothetical protein
MPYLLGMEGGGVLEVVDQGGNGEHGMLVTLAVAHNGFKGVHVCFSFQSFL